MLKKEKLNEEPFDTLFRLSDIAWKSKNYTEANVIDEVLLKKARKTGSSIGECYLKYFNHDNRLLRLKNFERNKKWQGKYLGIMLGGKYIKDFKKSLVK